MELTKIIVILAIIFAITIALAVHGIGMEEEKPLSVNNPNTIGSSSATLPKADHIPEIILPSKRVSRFLKQDEADRNPRAADHCHKDNDVCNLQNNGHTNSTCCNNKCEDLATDNHNCGACKTMCKFTQSCCRGECVYISLDKRHCGGCNHRCNPGEYCVYGLCNYA